MTQLTFQTRMAGFATSAACGTVAGTAGSAVGGPILGISLAFAAGACCAFLHRGVAEFYLAITFGLLGLLLASLPDPSLALLGTGGSAAVLVTILLVRSIHETWRKGYDYAQRAYEELMGLPEAPAHSNRLIHVSRRPHSFSVSEDGQLLRN